MLHFKPDKTKIIFFDLEYYVPEESRKRSTPSGMVFSPVLPGHKILGGTFQTYYPLLDRIGPARNFWEWSHGSEQSVLSEIIALLEKEWASIERDTSHASPMLGGIGISHSDIPILLAKITSYGLAKNERIFDLICGCRQIDLSTATYCQFSFNNKYFSYPKSKAHLYQKYLAGKIIESGKSVWELYEKRDHPAIQSRCESEVADSISIYKSMFDHKRLIDRDLSKLKRMEKEAKAATVKADG